MSRPRIVFLDEGSVLAEAGLASLRRLAGDHGRGYRAFDRTEADAIAERLSGAEVAITNKCPIDAALINSPEARGLKLVLVAATGYNIIDTKACAEAGVQVVNVRGYASDAVAAHALALILGLLNKVRANHQHCRSGRWSASPRFCLFDDVPRQLSRMRAGIVGYGSVGRQLAEYLGTMGAEILLAARDSKDKRPGRLPLGQLLGEADIVSLHCPLTPQTRHMISQKELALMPRHSLLINTARGGLIDEDALARALDERRIGGAGLDVLETEPPPRDAALLHCRDDCLALSPHIAWAGDRAQERLLASVAGSLEEFLVKGRVAGAIV